MVTTSRSSARYVQVPIGSLSESADSLTMGYEEQEKVLRRFVIGAMLLLILLAIWLSNTGASNQAPHVRTTATTSRSR